MYIFKLYDVNMNHYKTWHRSCNYGMKVGESTWMKDDQGFYAIVKLVEYVA